jgi:hypothetical protein
MKETSTRIRRSGRADADALHTAYGNLFGTVGKVMIWLVMKY